MASRSRINTLDKFIKTLVGKSWGFTLSIISFVIFISILTYNKYDPSFNVSTTNGEVYNIFGIFGSYISDLLIQLIGTVSFLFCLVLFFLGINVIKGTVHTSLYFKTVFMLVFLISSSTFFSAIFPQVNYWGNETWGGAIGYFINNAIPVYFLYPSIIISLILSLISISVVLDIKPLQWKEIFVGFGYFVKVSLTYLFKILKPFMAFISLILPRELISKTSSILKYVVGWKLWSKISNLFSGKQKEDTKTMEDESEVEIEEISIAEELVDDANDVDPNSLQARKIEKMENKGKLTKKLQTLTNKYKMPVTALLKNPPASGKNFVTGDELKRQSKLLYSVLEDFGIKGEMLGQKAGPIITLHEFEPAAGTRAARVMGLSDDIARSMSAVSARISVIPGKTAMGVELPNKKRETIYFRELLESNDYKNTSAKLPLILGKGIGGDPVIADLAKMPHLLVAGTTGSGKSVGINAMIMSLLYKLTPEECKFIMVDPKMLELSAYDGIPHLLTPVITEPGKAVVGLKWVVNEMENRYRAMSSLGVRNISNYNEKIKECVKRGDKLHRTVQTGFDLETGEPKFERIELDMKPLPYIIVIVDEMADLMLVAGKEIESLIQRLAQMARAAGIHLIMATQRPSVDVITGVIKANFPTRISFQVTSKIDSRTILGGQGAEQLLGMGDMLYMHGGSKIIRAHGPFVSDGEVENIVSFIKKQGFEPDYIDDVVIGENDGGYGIKGEQTSLFGESSGDKDEDLYREAVIIVKRDKKASTSYIQRQLRIGYNKAANLMERMEREGVVSEAGRNGKREILEES